MLKTSYEFGEVHNLLSQVYAGPENVEFRSIFDNSNGGVSLLAFRKEILKDEGDGRFGRPLLYCRL